MPIDTVHVGTVIATLTVWWEAVVLKIHKRSPEGTTTAALRTLETTGTLLVNYD